MVSNQGVLLLAVGGTRQYFRNCAIEGTTDFIFGAATAVFDKCVILNKKNLFVTAASTPAGQAYGFVFRDCQLMADTTRATRGISGPALAALEPQRPRGVLVLPAGRPHRPARLG